MLALFVNSLSNPQLVLPDIWSKFTVTVWTINLAAAYSVYVNHSFVSSLTYLILLYEMDLATLDLDWFIKSVAVILCSGN